MERDIFLPGKCPMSPSLHFFEEGELEVLGSDGLAIPNAILCQFIPALQRVTPLTNDLVAALNQVLVQPRLASNALRTVHVDLAGSLA
jgi:hypothetical protein